MAPWRAAVIGWTGRGDYGHGLDAAFLGVPDVEVVAVSDPDPQGRAAAALRCGAPRTYASYEQMLEREAPHLVAVAPRHADTHSAMVVAAARHGAHIFCEKPLAASLAEADAMVAACDEAGVRTAVAHQNRAWPTPRKARALIQAGAIGRLRAMRAYGKLDHRGGGQDLMVLGTHMLDMMRYFAGDARWVDARVTQDARDASAADVTLVGDGVGPVVGNGITATYGFDGGVTGTFESFVSDSGGRVDYFRIELYGTGGILAFPSGPRQELLLSQQPSLVPGKTQWEPVEVPPLKGELLNEMHLANQALVRDLLQAVAQERPPVSSIHDARAALEMIMGVYVSHFSGSRVQLPLVAREHPLSAYI